MVRRAADLRAHAGAWARTRRVLLALVALGFLGGGLAGAYSYGQNYYVDRGFTPPPRLPHADAGRLMSVHFYSPALRKRGSYLVYLPTGYTAARQYPVYYLLHGVPGRSVAYTVIGHIEVRLDNLISQGRVPPMILVFPDGRINGDTFSDSEWANTSAGRYDSFVVDVVHNVDRRFATIADRAHRVIAGLSAGAFGAMNVTLHHLPVFGSVQAWSGYFVETKTGVFAHATRAQLAYNSPLQYVHHLRRKLAAYPLRAFLFVGRGDSSSRQIVPMATALRANGAHVRYAIYAGGHDWELWNHHLEQMLMLAGRDVTQPLAPAEPGAPVRLRHGARRHRRTQRHHHEPVHHSLAAQPVPHRTTGVRSTVVLQRSSPATSPTRSLLGGLLLALLSAAAINLGFLLQHRGLRGIESPAGRRLSMVSAVLRSRSWLGGQALGWLGFGVQVAAVAIAPLSLVQSFAAGGFALSVPLAAGLFGQRLRRGAVAAVLVAATALALLPIGLPATSNGLRPDGLVLTVMVVLLAAVPVGLVRGAACRAIAAGLFYGAADAGIKALATGWSGAGAGVLLSGWGLLAAVGTLGGFVTFQAALKEGSAVTAISLMSVVTAVVALSCGVVGFGETLGASTGVVILHAVAIAVVLACLPILATAHMEIEDALELPLERSRMRLGRPLIAVARGVAGAVGVLAALLSGLGWLYILRGLGWFAIGPPVKDALPLLQLPGFDVQPLGRIAVAFLAVGVVAGYALGRLSRPWRGAIGMLSASGLLLLASQASFALTRNFRFSEIVWSRAPGPGPWIEAAVFAFGCLVVGSVWRREHGTARQAAPAREHIELPLVRLKSSR